MAIGAASQLKVGTRADIHIHAGLYKGHYPSRLEDIEGELLALSHPLLRGALLPIYRDMQFEVMFEDERSPIAVRVSTVRSDLASSAPLLWVRPIGEFIRIQRRRFLRVPCLLKAAFFPLDVEARSPMRGDWRECDVLDISLGGARLRSSDMRGLAVGDRVLLSLTIEGSPFMFVAKIVRFQEGVDGLKEIAVEFESLFPLAEAALIKFIRKQELSR